MRKFLKTMVAAVVFAIALSAGKLAAQEPGAGTFEAFLSQQGDALPRTAAEVDAFYQTSPLAKTYKMLGDYFPEDAAILKAKTLEIYQSGKAPLEVAARFKAVVAKIRSENAGDAFYASDATLHKYLKNQVALLRTFKDDIATCNRLGISGPSALDPQQLSRITPLLDEEYRLVLQAIHEGKTTPKKRGEVTQAIYAGLFIELNHWMTKEDYAVISKPDPGNPKLCKLSINYLNTIEKAGFVGADSMRAETVKSLIKD
jgi:hypothetical protein